MTRRALLDTSVLIALLDAIADKQAIITARIVKIFFISTL